MDEGWLDYHLRFVPSLLELLLERDPAALVRSSWPDGMPRTGSPGPREPAPLEAGLAKEADAEALWRHLVGFVTLVATRTGEPAPRLIGGRILGWPAEAVRAVAARAVDWLRECEYRITHDAFFVEYFEQTPNVITVIRRACVRYGAAEPRHPAYLRHACPTCREHAVVPEFGASGLVAVRCDECEARWPRDDWHRMRHAG